MNEQELREKFYNMLMQFTHGNTPSHDRLLRLGYSEEDIKTALNNSLIEKAGKNSFGIVIYGITPHGKDIRDK